MSLTIEQLFKAHRLAMLKYMANPTEYNKDRLLYFQKRLKESDNALNKFYNGW